MQKGIIMIFDVFLFVTAITSLMVTIVLYIIYKHANLKSLVTSLTLQQHVVTKQENVSIIHDIECTCKIQWYTICT